MPTAQCTTRPGSSGQQSAQDEKAVPWSCVRVSSPSILEIRLSASHKLSSRVSVDRPSMHVILFEYRNSLQAETGTRYKMASAFVKSSHGQQRPHVASTICARIRKTASVLATRTSAAWCTAQGPSTLVFGSP